MAGAISATHDSRTPEIRRLHKKIAMRRLLLMERARMHSKDGKFGPGLFVDLVRLLEECEKNGG